MEATITRSDAGQEHFTVTLNRHVDSRPRVLTMDRQGLRSHLREWKLGERAIIAILSVPLGMTIRLHVSNFGGRGEQPSSVLVA